MNDPRSASCNDVADTLDNALNALRSDPNFWKASLDTALRQLFTAACPALHLDRIELLQAQSDNRQLPTRFSVDTTGSIDAPSNIKCRLPLRSPIFLTGSLWGELTLLRRNAADWSPAEHHAAATLTDLIAQLLIQSHAHNAEQRFLGLAQNAPVAILQVDENRHVVYRNRQLLDLLGRDYPEIDQQVLSRFVIPEGEDDLAIDTETLNSTGQIQRTYRIVHADGSTRHTLWHVVREQRDPQTSSGYGRIGIGIDITDLWQAQQALTAMTLQQRAILDNAAHAIIATDPSGNITLFNPAAERLLGYKAEEVLGKSARLFHLPHEVANSHKTLRQLRYEENIYGYVNQARQGGQETEWTYQHKDGTHIPVAISTTALRDANGNTTGYMGMVIDLRERDHLLAAEEREQALIKHINLGISAAVGEQFFDNLVAALRNTLKADHLNIIELDPDRQPLQGKPLSETHYDIPGGVIFFEGTPLEEVMSNARSVHVRDMQEKYAGLHEMIAVPLLSSDGRVLGALVAAHNEAFAEPQLIEHLLQIFAVRASTELERVHKARERKMHDNEQRWLYTASEAIHSQQDIDAVAHEASIGLAAHHSAPRVSFAIREDDTYRILDYVGPPDKAPLQKIYQRAPTLFGGAIDAKNSILIFPNFIEAMRGTLNVQEFVAREMNSVVIIGLIDNGTDIGAIMLEYSDRSILHRLNLDVLGMFGRAVTLALARAQHRRKLEYQASHDALTGLFNRAALHHEFQHWRNNGGEHTALLLLDLDRFKDVNDTFGHHIGDALLLQVGARLRAGLNYRKAKLTRLGGDEFAVLLLDTYISAEHAKALAQNIQVEIRKPFCVNGINLEVGVSIGIALYPEHGSDSHALLRSADVAMYKIKRSGGGAALYDNNFDLNSPERLALISDLSRGIRTRQLTLHYQPKIDLRSGAVTGFEGLLRWQHPQHGLLAPENLLPLIEMSDAIHELTHSLLESACAQLKRWIDTGKNWNLSINLSARNLIDDRIVRNLAELMHVYELPPDRLELEITENALIGDPQRVLELLDRIAALGIRLSIDDFGTGYSSLAYIRQMPISILKIDGTFISEMASNSQDELIVSSIIQLAHGLNLKVIAEGVETAELLAQLLAMQCDEAQGFYFTQALPLADLELWLADR